jgi:transglutaminase-like putative cysteine protease
MKFKPIPSNFDYFYTMTRLHTIVALTFLLLSILVGCNMHPPHQNISYAETLLENGDLTDATKLAQKMVKSYDLSASERSRLDSVLEICTRIRKDFTMSDTDMLLILKKYNPSIDQSELRRLEKEHKLDVRSLDDEKRYFKNSVGNLFRLDSVYAKLKAGKDGSSIDSFPNFKIIHTTQILKESTASGVPVYPIRMKLSYTIRVAPDAIPAGDTLHCWMPYPREQNVRQQDIHLLSTIPARNLLSPSSDLQRTLYLEQVAIAQKPIIFHSELEFTCYAQTFQFTPEQVKPYQKQSKLYKQYTAERAPQIVFTDSIIAIKNRILQGETNPLLQVRKIYKWINDSVTWASALEYSIMADIPGFVLENRHGDCGMQTMLFMTLARSAGIPVKWQSGWMLHPGEVNLHDWCEVWYEGIGWVPLDQSFGLQKSLNEKIRDFYVTGIDAYRLIVNDDFSQHLSPPKKFYRSEPYDFQRGEVEWRGGNLYFDKWSWHMDVTYDSSQETMKHRNSDEN